MRVNTTAMLQYENVIMNNDITMAIGMSLVGFLASSPLWLNKLFESITKFNIYLINPFIVYNETKSKKSMLLPVVATASNPTNP